MSSSLSLIIIGAITFYLCYLQYKIAKFSKDWKDKVYVMVWMIFFILCNFVFYSNLELLSPVDLILIVGYGCMVAFFWGFHIIYKRILGKSGVYMKPVDEVFQENKENLHEFMRKFFHFFVFFGCLIFVVLYSTISLDVLQQYPDFAAYGRNPVWEDSFLAPLNVDFRVKPWFFKPLQMQVAMIILFMIAIPFAIIAEYFRLNPRLGIPFQPLFVKSLRPHEQHNAADYYYFTFGFFVAAFLLPAAAAFGVLCVMCFGDTFASLVGKRWPKNKKHFIRWEPKKCWEGSIVGFICTFVSALWFVGWILALVLSFIFIIIDVITPTKLKVSDNMLYPFISMAVIFVILFLGFQIDSVVVNYFNEINQWFLSNQRTIIY
ncbi:MAG: hypothetical protein EU535_08000 [Promethearchaeota archaeon]|nr:MAG: hypothetical protein EU535_08000 [Candidatus Lokiarchaeota archaeon]